jgi:hypothetical protein
VRGQSNPLFHQADISALRDGRLRQLEGAVNAIEPNRLLNSSVEDLVSYFADSFKLDTPRLRRDDAVVEQRETQVQIRDVFESRTIETTGTLVELTIPFDGDSEMFGVRPNRWSLSPPRAEVTAEGLVLKITGRELQPNQVKSESDRQLTSIDEYLAWLRVDTDAFNTSIPQIIRTQIAQRRKKLLDDRNLVSNLGFSLKKRPEAPKTYAAPVSRKRIEPRMPPASTAPFKPEPALVDAEYANILDIVSNMARVMERSPSAFASIDEEDLRQHFLVQLNGQYEGQATGETFNYQGKTDILLRVDGRNIFIAECKYWRGAKSYVETIDQVLSYISWRDTKIAVIVFNRNKEFANVLTQIRALTREHHGYKSGPVVEGETRFRYIFGQKADQSREVVLTVLAFDVPNPV